jgi:hypothetical protein
MRKHKERKKTVRPFGVHPADLPENKGKRCPDYLKAPWASEQSRLHAKILDEMELQERNR